MSKLLMDDYPVMVLPKLATEIGLNEAIVLQQIHYWLENYRVAGKMDHYQDGQWWVYNTKSEWQKNFPWWSENTVWRTLINLRDRSLLIATSDYNKIGYDRTLWYTINYPLLEEIEKCILPNWENEFNQNGKTDLTKMVSPIPETNTEISSEISAEEEHFAKSSSASAASKPEPEPVPELDQKAATVYRAYEGDIGMITKTVADEIDAMLEEGVPAEYFTVAFAEAARNNKRSWSYARAILKRMAVEGIGPPRSEQKQRMGFVKETVSEMLDRQLREIENGEQTGLYSVNEIDF